MLAKENFMARKIVVTSGKGGVGKTSVLARLYKEYFGFAPKFN